MIVNHLMVQVLGARVVDMVPKLLAMVVHYFPSHCQKDPAVMFWKVMKLVGSVGQGGYIFSTDRVRLTSWYWTSGPSQALLSRGKRVLWILI